MALSRRIKPGFVVVFQDHIETLLNLLRDEARRKGYRSPDESD
ncbi:hypothetical protein ABENE_18770 [Asticcacaulis benevestitus DSM 16100 = ATCC BAA-896]|uniref:Uncharacterized protein n=1 Tax=Asticcacaulis benevestitus DSM 16100 = ATCC BAA-896 TaxID=1121022 RepID=V4PBU6_9CAUL|nr:hypothetical protein ABENE_18770 [Asticcacaulis benevestitus DSM 16100 = ATCC BAA-896]